jgi:hypothetical protein
MPFRSFFLIGSAREWGAPERGFRPRTLTPEPSHLLRCAGFRCAMGGCLSGSQVRLSWPSMLWCLRLLCCGACGCRGTSCIVLLLARAPHRVHHSISARTLRPTHIHIHTYTHTYTRTHARTHASQSRDAHGEDEHDGHWSVVEPKSGDFEACFSVEQKVCVRTRATHTHTHTDRHTHTRAFESQALYVCVSDRGGHERRRVARVRQGSTTHTHTHRHTHTVRRPVYALGARPCVRVFVCMYLRVCAHLPAKCVVCVHVCAQAVRRRVAVKVFDRQRMTRRAISRMLSEVTVMNNLRHRNIVQ